jgi:hypothetical protein
MSMDDQTKEQFLKLAGRAFREQRRTADACYAHTQSCFVCRGVANRWTHWLVDFLFICPTVKSLEYDVRVAKADADEYRLELASPELEVPSLEWLDGLYALRDDRSE